MRTSIEISELQHQALNSLAKKRGLRGFSQIVQEAIDCYLNDLAGPEVDHILSPEGSLSEAEANELWARINESRSTWRAS